MKSRLAALLAAVALLITSAPNALADDPSPGLIIADAVIVRPVGVVITVVSSAAFVVALPFAAIARRVPETAENMIAKPARSMFCRPLGDFKRMRHENVGHYVEERR